MNGLDVLIVGLGLGARHAMDADHVVVVSTLLSHEATPWRAARLAVLWGAGHTFAFLGLGILVVVTGLQVPQPFERFASVAVACALIGVGAWHIARTFGQRVVDTVARPVVFLRPLAMGVVHGLAGSAGVALVAATTMSSRTAAASYLGLVALGTVLGMVALTLVMARPLAWTMQREGALKKCIALSAGGIGVCLGVWILYGAISPSPA